MTADKNPCSSLLPKCFPNIPCYVTSFSFHYYSISTSTSTFVIFQLKLKNLNSVLSQLSL